MKNLLVIFFTLGLTAVAQSTDLKCTGVKNSVGASGGLTIEGNSYVFRFQDKAGNVSKCAGVSSGVYNGWVEYSSVKTPQGNCEFTKFSMAGNLMRDRKGIVSMYAPPSGIGGGGESDWTTEMLYCQ